MRPERGFAAVVLAAQRAGQVDPLAADAGVSHKCLVPVAAKPMIAHVIAALRATPGLAILRVVIEPEAAPLVEAALPPGPAVEFIPAADNLADSVHAATHDLDQPVIVTTADNVLLSPEAVLRMAETVTGRADVAVAMATRASVLAAHPEGQRRFYRFRDDFYSNCNLYAFSGRDAFAAAEAFRGGGQFAKKPMRLVAAIGLINVALFLMGKLTLPGAMARLSRGFGLTVRAVILTDGAHAIDVDNARTYGVATQLLAARAA